MASQTNKTELIARVRRLIGDPPAEDMQFSSQDIAETLDLHRCDIRYAELRAEGTIAQGGSVSYLDFYAEQPNFDQGAVLVDGGYGTVTPSSSDFLRGYFHFGTAPTRPVMIVGAHYDLYGAAADLCEEWASKVKTCVDFQDDRTRFALSQRYKQLLEQAEQYRRKQRPGTVQIERTDVSMHDSNRFVLPIRH